MVYGHAYGNLFRENSQPFMNALVFRSGTSSSDIVGLRGLMHVEAIDASCGTLELPVYEESWSGKFPNVKTPRMAEPSAAQLFRSQDPLQIMLRTTAAASPLTRQPWRRLSVQQPVPAPHAAAAATAGTLARTLTPPAAASAAAAATAVAAETAAVAAAEAREAQLVKREVIKKEEASWADFERPLPRAMPGSAPAKAAAAADAVVPNQAVALPVVGGGAGTALQNHTPEGSGLSQPVSGGDADALDVALGAVRSPFRG